MSYIQVFQEINFQLWHLRLAELPVPRVIGPQYHDNPQFALGKVHQLDLLDRNGLPGVPVERPIDRSEGSFAQAVTQLL